MLFGNVLRCCLFSIEAAASGSWCPRRKENEELRHQLKQVPSNSIDFQCVLPHVCRKQTWLKLQNNRRHNSSTTAQHPHTAMNWWSMQDIRLLTSQWAGNVQSQILSMPFWQTFAAKDGSCNVVRKHVCFCIVQMNVHMSG